MAWQRRFEDPIPLPKGKPLVTLRDAGDYIAGLSAKAQRAAHWQTAAEAVLMAAQGRGPLMHARIAMMKALNFGKPEPPLERRGKRVKAYRIIR